jgi:hypothetical protein
MDLHVTLRYAQGVGFMGGQPVGSHWKKWLHCFTSFFFSHHAVYSTEYVGCSPGLLMARRLQGLLKYDLLNSISHI